MIPVLLCLGLQSYYVLDLGPTVSRSPVLLSLGAQSYCVQEPSPIVSRSPVLLCPGAKPYGVWEPSPKSNVARLHAAVSTGLPSC
jgi:hypothetical protein